MKYLKKLGMSFIYIIGTLLILTLITTTFSYFNIFNDKVTSIIKIIIPIISMFIGGFYIGKNSNKKGFLEGLKLGLKLGLIFSLFLIIFNYLALFNSFEFKHLLFYIILIISSIFGSMIGIMKKNEK